jgi:hypothetical protein
MNMFFTLPSGGMIDADVVGAKHTALESVMNTKVKLALAASLVLGSAGLFVGSASALPMSGIDKSLATTDVQQKVEDVRWICGPWGCHWAPGAYWGGYGYGWHGGWHGWHRHW